jgi:GTP cyclohydrolase II
MQQIKNQEHLVVMSDTFVSFKCDCQNQLNMVLTKMIETIQL